MTGPQLVPVLLLVATAAFSQGGSAYVGGLVGFNISNTEANGDQTTTSWSFSPEVGTFFNDEWSGGVVLGLSGSKVTNDDGDVSDMFVFSPALYGRRWWVAGDHLSLFAGLDLSFGTGTSTTNGPADVEADLSSFGANLNAGAALAMAERWTLLFKFAALGYASQEAGGVTTSDLGLLVDGNVTTNQFIFIG